MQKEAAVKVVPISMDITSLLEAPSYGSRRANAWKDAMVMLGVVSGVVVYVMLAVANREQPLRLIISGSDKGICAGQCVVDMPSPHRPCAKGSRESLCVLSSSQ